jgi:hypothetical protein
MPQSEQLTPQPPESDVLELLEADEQGDVETNEDELAQLEAETGADLALDDGPKPTLGRSWAFDFASGRFITKPGGGPIETQGMATLRTWIEKALRTARGAHRVYAQSSFGLAAGLDVGGIDPSLDDLEGRCRQALTLHPRITDVRDFRITPDPDDEEVSLVGFLVLTDEAGTELEVKDVSVRFAEELT